jgi:hypothetical protein
MNSLVLMSYRQPVEGSKFRWGVKLSNRNTKKDPLSETTLKSYYRKYDPMFVRTQNIETVKTPKGVKAFYKERTRWRISIPFIGSLVSPFLKSK